MWLTLLVGLSLLLVGTWQLTTPTDELWQRHERWLLSRGLAPQRNTQWEKSQRNKSWTLLIFGIFILSVLAINSIKRAWAPPQMSGVTMMGRQLTQKEWDNCGRNVHNCMMDEAIRQSKANRK